MELDDQWFSEDGEHEGRPSLIRVRSHLTHLVGLKTHPHLLCFSWEYDENTKDGMPDSEQSSDMAMFEQTIFQALESDHLCIFYCVYLYDGMQAWYAYSADVDKSVDMMNEALSSHPAYPVEITVDKDSLWEDYKDVLDGTAYVQE